MATIRADESQSKGLVAVEAFRDRLRLRLPRQLFGGKQKY
jgi:integrase